MAVPNIDDIQRAIRQEGLDGWLFSNFRHRDKLADDILGIDKGLTNSRTWVYAVPAEGEPVRIVHAVEAGHLDSLPGKKSTYISREEFLSLLRKLSNKAWGVHLSRKLPAISYLDAGSAAAFEEAGLRLVSAASLIQRFKGLLDIPGMESHERASKALYAIVEDVWGIVRRAYAEKRDLYEGELREAMLKGMEDRGIETDHPPIVAAGANSGDPHYDFSGAGSLIQAGAVIQFDLWAKEKAEASIYGDISWVGVYAQEPAPGAEKAFADLVSAREGAFDFIAAELAADRRPTGAMVDRKTRDILTRCGYAGAIKHRTGHGIDTECHGSGANIDSVEFPDERLLLDGSCFSLEPGIYFDDFGLRTEIDVYIRDGKALISGGDRQFKLLTC
ncbi:M24 family metallopeptidase [Treponema sp. OttesenSCG-928-L16]|nr:M24 family metallopeptidase [Treponema sp. OttesenSCG-928-L16]